jgi:CheY-like chemotaxis protein
MSQPRTITRVLVVEDEESVREAIEAGLETIGGFEVTVAADGQAGLALVESTRPDVLLLDFLLPDIDGLQVAKVIRSTPGRYRPTKVVLMSAHANPVPSGKLSELGLDDLLPKPFRLNDLARAVTLDS